MKFYYFNNATDINGYHEVHTDDCAHLPNIINRTYIGYYSSCSEAISKAKAEHPNFAFDGCFWCCRECHHG